MKEEVLFIQAILNDDDRVFGQFYQFYFDKMSAMLLQMGAKHDEVEDYFQDGIIIFVQKVRSGFKPKDNQKIGGYLRTIIRNLYLKTKRKMSKHPTESLDQAAHKQIEESAFADIDRVAFVDAITELKKKDMKIILLRFFCEMKYEKIAQNMGYTDRKPAHMAFTRAINKLRIILTKKNIL